MSYFKTLPETTDRQFFICENGCGICTPIHDGTEWVSDCCHSGLQVWDNDVDDVVIE